MYHSSRMILFSLAGFATLMSTVAVVSNTIITLSASGCALGAYTPIQEKPINNLCTVGSQHGLANECTARPDGGYQRPLH